jgi:hypothetical protein
MISVSGSYHFVSQENYINFLGASGKLSHLGPIFSRKFRGKFRGKFSPQKCWKKLEFSAEKVSKNCFSKKYHRILRIGPWTLIALSNFSKMT